MLSSPCDTSTFSAAADVVIDALECPEARLVPLTAESASGLSSSPCGGLTSLFRFLDDWRGEQGRFEGDKPGLKAGEKCRTDGIAVFLFTWNMVDRDCNIYLFEKSVVGFKVE